MIVKLNMLINNNAVDNIDRSINKICSYIGCNKNDLYYIEGITDSLFTPSKVFLEEDSISYCNNREGYAFVIFKSKENGNCFIINEKFVKDLKVIEKISNRLK